MITFSHLKQVTFVCLLVLLNVQTVFAGGETDQTSQKAAIEKETNEQQSSKKHKKSSFDTVADIVLSPAHYAILLGGELLPHPTSKGDPTSQNDVSDGDNITRKWNHKLPFMAQEVIDRGFSLPNPYGFSGIFSRTRQDVTLSNLRISFGTDPDAPKTQIPFVSFEQPKTDARTWEVKPDAWLLPFLNVYLIGGRIDGSALVPIIVPGEATLKGLLPELGALCDKPAGFPGRPEACDKDIVLLDNSNYTGTNYGLGMTLAAGWKNFFFALPFSYVWSDLSNTSTRVTALNVSGRVGYSIKPKRTGMLSFYTGATYLNTKQDVEGIFRFDTGSPVIGEIDINYTISEQGTKPWNLLAGFNWTLTPNWWIQAELGFRGRKDIVASVSYRW